MSDGPVPFRFPPGPPSEPVTEASPFLSIAFSAPELCTRCGSCAGVCPTQAITTDERHYPVLIADRCIACGLCGAVCPGKEVNYGDLAEQVFGERFVDRGFDGWVEKTYVGFATDERLRRGGAGGGMVTGLLYHLLKSGAVEGCLVTRMNRERPWAGEPFIATTYEELCESQGSRYSIIPINTLWGELRKRPGRYAAAILPCQTHAYRKLQRHDPELAANITAVVGLFCGGSLEPNLTTEMLRMRGIKREDIRDFKFRGGEWPGQMQAVLKDGTAKPLHYSNYKDGAYNYFTSLYMPERCQTCLDGSNEFADVSVSDAWTRDEKGEYKFKEHSRLLIRTARGADLVRRAAEAGDIVIKDVSTDPSYKTHKMQTRRKGSLAPLRVDRWARAGRRVPVYDRGLPDDVTGKERLTERLSSALLYMGKWTPLRMAVMGFLTSRYAIPLIKIRLWLKKRKYARKRRGSSAAPPSA
ncbi:MAG TPA: Coenzyme F420 hydrogenase/dehydrogenase, beta subunit C-terminal domain [Kiritimatiellia bacterium]|nr:Coenzyme F420 hydrogenase/dehydrogenase, beta subunit C-terminal domain [Kiritimatiellia bacterium]HMO98710.1 Coenzyme F420 hydrogenase/dehydrogenase, beta subunit C-terminal domain [Kiritimatiellia bacterium]HMP97854.1 Coenzyme F420 hydrogenase/dehydrogenase, beta subunit C-terminal domain [Kiritimatiellia bacterium]